MEAAEGRSHTRNILLRLRQKNEPAHPPRAALTAEVRAAGGLGPPQRGRQRLAHVRLAQIQAAQVGGRAHAVGRKGAQRVGVQSGAQLAQGGGQGRVRGRGGLQREEVIPPLAPRGGNMGKGPEKQRECQARAHARE